MGVGKPNGAWQRTWDQCGNWGALVRLGHLSSLGRTGSGPGTDPLQGLGLYQGLGSDPEVVIAGPCHSTRRFHSPKIRTPRSKEACAIIMIMTAPIWPIKINTTHKNTALLSKNAQRTWRERMESFLTQKEELKHVLKGHKNEFGSCDYGSRVQWAGVELGHGQRVGVIQHPVHGLPGRSVKFGCGVYLYTVSTDWSPEGTNIHLCHLILGTVSGQQCLPKGPVKSRASCLESKAHHLVGHSAGHLDPCGLVDPWGLPAGSSVELLPALTQSAEDRSSCCSLIAFQTVWGPSKSLSHHPAAAPAPTGSSTTQSDLGSMPLSIKRYFPARPSSFLVWNQPPSPRRCLSQRLSLAPKDLCRGRTYTQVCGIGQNLDLLDALSPSFPGCKRVLSARLPSPGMCRSNENPGNRA